MYNNNNNNNNNTNMLHYRKEIKGCSLLRPITKHVFVVQDLMANIYFVSTSMLHVLLYYAVVADFVWFV